MIDPRVSLLERESMIGELIERMTNAPAAAAGA